MKSGDEKYFLLRGSFGLFDCAAVNARAVKDILISVPPQRTKSHFNYINTPIPIFKFETEGLAKNKSIIILEFNKKQFAVFFEKISGPTDFQRIKKYDHPVFSQMAETTKFGMVPIFNVEQVATGTSHIAQRKFDSKKNNKEVLLLLDHERILEKVEWALKDNYLAYKTFSNVECLEVYLSDKYQEAKESGLSVAHKIEFILVNESFSNSIAWRSRISKNPKYTPIEVFVLEKHNESDVFISHLIETKISKQTAA